MFLLLPSIGKILIYMQLAYNNRKNNVFFVFSSVDDWQSTILPLFNYRSELLVAHLVTVVSNFSQQCENRAETE